jgi:uncharacterized protein (DUF983 family)
MANENEDFTVVKSPFQGEWKDICPYCGNTQIFDQGTHILCPKCHHWW